PGRCQPGSTNLCHRGFEHADPRLTPLDLPRAEVRHGFHGGGRRGHTRTVRHSLTVVNDSCQRHRALAGGGAPYVLNRPAKPRRGRSELVSNPGGAATTDAIALSAGSPVTVMPIDAKLSGFDRSTPGFGKIMCLL